MNKIKLISELRRMNLNPLMERYLIDLHQYISYELQAPYAYNDIINKHIDDYLLLSSEDKDILDEIIKNSPVNTHAFTVYRGIAMNNIDLFIEYTGEFMPTSLVREVASEFVEGECCLLEITVPIGKHMVFVGFNEYEMLFNRDSILRIVDKIDHHTYSAVIL